MVLGGGGGGVGIVVGDAGFCVTCFYYFHNINSFYAGMLNCFRLLNFVAEIVYVSASVCWVARHPPNSRPISLLPQSESHSRFLPSQSRESSAFSCCHFFSSVYFYFFPFFWSIINKCSTIFQLTIFFSLFIRDKFVLFFPPGFWWSFFCLCIHMRGYFLQACFFMFYYLLDSVCFHLCIQCLVFCGSNGLRRIATD